MLPADRALAGGRHHAGQRAHPFGVRDRHRLGDHPAHRHAADVRGLEPQVVEEAEGVVGQVGQGVRHAHPAAGRGPEERGSSHPADAAARAAGIAVVEADHVEAATGEHPAQLVVPPGHGPAQPHHQQ
jgi:hypothetical protein